MTGEPGGGRPQPLAGGRVRLLHDVGEAPGAAVGAVLVAEHRQIEEQQRIAPGLSDAAEAVFDRVANLVPGAAVQQDVQGGRQALHVQAREERGPPVHEDRRDPPVAVEEVQRGGQRLEQPDDVLCAALAGEGRLAGQHEPQGGGHFRSDVPDVPVLLRVADQQAQRPQLRRRRQTLQAADGGRSRAGAAGHDLQQKPFRRQNEAGQLPSEVFGALQVPFRECEPAVLPALIGGLEETHRLQIQEPVVVGGTPAGLGQRAFGPAVRVLRVVEGGQLQPRRRIVGELLRHVPQDTLDPRLGGGLSAQQIEDEEVAVAVVGIGRETRGHQLDQGHPGDFQRPAEQDGHRLLHVVRQELGTHRAPARPRQRFQHAGAREGLIRRPGKLRRQLGEEHDRGNGIPQHGRHPLRQQQDAGPDAIDPIRRQQTALQLDGRGQGEGVPGRRQPHDLQQVDPRSDGVLGIEGVGQAFNRGPDRAHLPLAHGPLQIGGQGRRPPTLAGQLRRRPGHLVAAAAAGDEVAGVGRVGQGEIGRQALENAAQLVVVARAEADHRLGEQAPGGERRAPRHPLQQVRGPGPVAGVHGVETGHDRRGVPPQRVAGVEDAETVPEALDDETIRERSFHLEHGRRLAHVLRIGGQGVRAVQIPDVLDLVGFRQRRQREGRPMPLRCGAHGGRFRVHALRGKLPGALHGGAEGDQRQAGQAVVPVPRLPDQIERLPPVSRGERAARLIQQAPGGCAGRARRRRPLAIAPVGQRRWCEIFDADPPRRRVVEAGPGWRYGRGKGSASPRNEKRRAARPLRGLRPRPLLAPCGVRTTGPLRWGPARASTPSAPGA